MLIVIATVLAVIIVSVFVHEIVDAKSYYGISENSMYYEAATRYKSEITVENTENANMWKEKMESAVSSMGAFSTVKADIDKSLGI